MIMGKKKSIICAWHKQHDFCIVLCVLIALLSTIGCKSRYADHFPRGDWYYDLSANYRLNRVNSKMLIIEKKDGSGVIDHFFVTGFSFYDEKIMVKGIHTEDIFVSNEELEQQILVFYVIDTSNDALLGPYATELDMLFHIGRENSTIDWIETKEIAIDNSFEVY